MSHSTELRFHCCFGKLRKLPSECQPSPDLEWPLLPFPNANESHFFLIYYKILEYLPISTIFKLKEIYWIGIILLKNYLISKRCHWSNNHLTYHFGERVCELTHVCLFKKIRIQIQSITHLLDWILIEKRKKEKKLLRWEKKSVTPLYVFVMTMNIKTVNTVFNNRPNTSLVYWIYVNALKFTSLCLFIGNSFYLPVKHIDGFLVDSFFPFVDEPLFIASKRMQRACLSTDFLGVSTQQIRKGYTLVAYNHKNGLSQKQINASRDSNKENEP